MVFLSQDTGVVVWDIVKECGMFRLRGHTKEVMQARFVRARNFLVTWYVSQSTSSLFSEWNQFVKEMYWFQLMM